MAHLLTVDDLAAALNASVAQVAPPAAPSVLHTATVSASGRASVFPPLYGGGFLAALLQVAVVYYPTATVLHFVVPFLGRLPRFQSAARRRGQVTQEALNAIGEAAHIVPYVACVRYGKPSCSCSAPMLRKHV